MPTLARYPKGLGRRKIGSWSQIDRTHPLARGLQNYLFFTEAGGGIYHDQAGSAAFTPGATTAAPVWTMGPPGIGLKFSGAQYMTWSKLVIPSGNFTVSMLMVPTAAAANWAWTQGALAAGSYMGMGYNSTNVFRYEFAGTSILGTLASVINRAEPYRVTMTYDAGRTNKMIAYRDELQDLTNTTAATYTGDTNRIGASPATAPGSFFTGMIYDWIVWNRAISLMEQVWLTREPACMLLPGPPKRLFGLVTGAPPPPPPSGQVSPAAMLGHL
jgi:hypothetical protein